MGNVDNNNHEGVHSDSLMVSLQQIAHFVDQNNFHVALEILNDLLLKYPDEPIVLHNSGLINLHLNHLDSALTNFNHAIKINGNEPKHYNYAGIVNIKLGNYEQGIELLQRATKLNPKEAEFLYNLAIAYIKTNNFIEAEEYLLMAIENGYFSADLYFTLGNLVLHNGQIEAAKTYYWTALQYDKANLEYGHQLADLLIRLNLNTEAIKAYIILLQSHPNHELTCYKLGSLYFEDEKYHEAIPFLTKAIAKTNTLTYLQLGKCYNCVGKHSKALEIFEQGLETNPSTALLCNFFHACLLNSGWKLMNQFYYQILAWKIIQIM